MGMMGQRQSKNGGNPSSFSLRNYQSRQQTIVRKRNKSADDYVEVHLGRLRSVDFRIGRDLAASAGQGFLSYRDKLDGSDTFLLTRNSLRPHEGFGFSCDIGFSCSETGRTLGIWMSRQMEKPRRRFQGLQHSPLDIFDLIFNPQRNWKQEQNQVLGLVFRPLENSGHEIGEPVKQIISPGSLQGVDVFGIEGVVGHVATSDWTQDYSIQDASGIYHLTAQRFNRISGGWEFQIFEKNHQDDKINVCIATFLRLEESKFIVKIYTECNALLKTLIISYGIFSTYLLSL